MNRVLGVIPARIGSSRLPRKPLQPLLGKPLVTWVWQRARQMGFLDRVVVATDSDEVAQVCRDTGASVLMTSPEHPSGSDRAWEAAQRMGPEFDVVVNIQGDEPLVDPEVVRAAVSMVEAGFDVGTCATRIESDEEYHDPAVVKVVRARDGSALYFSRAAIPFRRAQLMRNGCRAVPRRLRHVGVYAYRRAALGRWVGFRPSALEMEEGLEQLRALENGMRIGVAVVAEAAGGIDTPEDLARMERRLKGAGADNDAERI